jgi:hypothetical protein
LGGILQSLQVGKQMFTGALKILTRLPTLNKLSSQVAWFWNGKKRGLQK